MMIRFVVTLVLNELIDCYEIFIKILWKKFNH